MLFDTLEFLFGFLPVILLCVFVTATFFGRKAGVNFLIAGSLFFYGWWNVFHLPIIVGSVVANLGFAHVILAQRSHRNKGRLPLAVGIIANLAVLGYFKYTNFFISTLSEVTSLAEPRANVVLPIGLSFYTLQQISFLVDIATGRIGAVTAREYAAAVLFFPHLIAGPLVHYRDIIGQFRDNLKISGATILTGLPVFVVGLTKKVVVADNIAAVVSPLFAKADGPIDFLAAWLAAIGYTAQLYFDFSGYSDMAVGLGLMFGIVLPINFFSPYKATSIIDFWRRWHITLSSFLRDHLYIPLGGGRCGSFRRNVNIMFVMLLGGLWHGAAWTFVAWGGLHGVYLLINHGWRDWVQYRLPVCVSGTLTFMCVVCGWVLFRASSFDAATHIYSGMIGLSGLELPGNIAYLLDLKAPWPGVRFTDTAVGFVPLVTGSAWIAGAMMVAWFAPNTAEIFGLSSGSPNSVHLESAPRPWMILATAVQCWLCLYAIFGAAPSEFLYFKF